MLSTLVTRNDVVMKLIKLRCKYANKQADIMQTLNFVSFAKIHSKVSNTAFRYDSDKNLIYSLFPPRKQWCHIGKQRIKMDATKRNEKKLLYTYCKAVKENSQEEWYMKLCQYADNIVKIVLNPGKSIPKPKVFVIEKKRKENFIICRPVCSFPLNVKIALSLVNRYLTRVLDDLFYPCSYAFRKPTKERGQFQHLNAVKAIQEYRKNHIGQSLFVAECDMQKFYDTINHNVIKMRFNMLISKAKANGNITDSEYRCVRQWFYNYLDCFDFNKDVYHYNSFNTSHPIWQSIKDKNDMLCKIEWIDEYLTNSKYEKKQKKGVPQGGALSGIIANIVMHYVDRIVLNSINNEDVIYSRFCDDMILIGTEKEKVQKVYDAYVNAIKYSKLYPHVHKNIELKKMANFWECKTKEPYEWDRKGKNVFPWITFVGFDCNWNGNLRIRKHSLKKQLDKQFTIMDDLIQCYKNPNNMPRYCRRTVLNSLHSRLIGMGIGRIGIRNFKNNENIHSWMSAFSILDKNPWSEAQLKLLDRHRCQVVHRAAKRLAKMKCPSYTKHSDDCSKKRRIYIGKPFSYYGQCFDY